MTDTAPSPAPAPAYGQIRARRSFLWGDRRLAAGEVVIDLRARGGSGDLKAFIDNLRWSAFEVVTVEAPPVPAQATADQLPPAVVDAPQEPILAQLARLISQMPAEELTKLPGIGGKAAEKLQSWATDTVAVPTPAPAAEV